MPARILLVDDDDLVRNSLYTILERDGYEVLAASNGAEALAIFRKAQPAVDVLVTDYNMPGMNGFELARECLAIRSEIKVLYVTGTGSSPDGDLAEELRTGKRTILHKPFRRHDLLRAVRELLLTDVHGLQFLHSARLEQDALALGVGY